MFTYIYYLLYIINLVKKVITKDKKMSDNAGSCIVVKFAPCNEVDERLQEFAEEYFDVVVTDYTDDGYEQLVGYLPSNAKETDLISVLKTWNLDLPEYSWETISSENWLTENVIKFSPVETDDFLVYGIHEKDIDTLGKIGIRVYAATAFGSEHQTTKCCLQAISDINKLKGAQNNILDVGTGSGILALACAKLWKNSKIIAVDIDDESVIVAKQNAIDNGVADSVEVAYSDGYSSEIVKSHSPYDVILANILARPLINMAQDLANNLNAGGYAIISGFIDEQVDWVIGEHEKYGLKLVKIYEMDNWRAALLEK